jgi:hypothetical protein
MNTKSSWFILAVLLLAVLFVPIIPNDVPINCTGDDVSCDSPQAYVSLYSKYISTK